jgi:hypothetical protein
MIDEVRVWEKVRTLTEIRSDMHREISGTEPGLVAYWRFNETSGNTAIDQTTNAHHGALQGGVTRGISTAFAPLWLTVTPTSGTVAIGSSLDMELAFNASHLDAGVVSADIAVVSNDPNKPKIRVPIRLDITSTGVEEYSDSKAEVPKNYLLFQNFPNPFNPTTTIHYELPEASKVILIIYDILGREIQTLVNERQQPGRYAVNLDAGKLVSGVYFYKLQAGSDFLETRKMLLLR